MKRILALPGLLLLTLASGCQCACLYQIRDEITDCKINYCNRAMAREAYCEIEPECLGLTCPNSFREGFLAGYVSVCEGNNGSLPPFAFVRCHNHMWLDFGAAECEKFEAWFDGYEHGAMCAKAEGMMDVNILVNRISMPMAQENSSRRYPSRGLPPTSAPSPEEVPEMEVPPTPKSESEEVDPQLPPPPQMPQTRRVPSSIFK